MRKTKALPPIPLTQTQAGQAERLLYWLLCYPLCSVAQLALFLGMDSTRAYRLLRLLEERQLIEWVEPASQGVRTGRLYYLSQAGLSLLAQCAPGESVAMLAQRWGTREQDLLRLFPRLPYLQLVETFLQGLVTFAPAMHARHGQRTRIGWHWQRDYTHHFLYRQRKELCRADAFVIWRARPQQHEKQAVQTGGSHGERWFAAFVLVDAGLLPQSLMRERLTEFFHYRESPERWSADYRSFPSLLILTTTGQRAELWRRAHLASQERIAGQVDPLLAVTTVITPAGGTLSAGAAPLNPWSHLAWRTLATGERCALDQALLPLEERGLPQDLLEHLGRVQELQLRGRNYKAGTHPLQLQQESPAPVDEKRQPRVVRGNFMARAHLFLYEKSAASTAEALASLGLVFGRRYLDILTLLYQAPLLSHEELAALTGLQPLSAYRYVRELQRFGCVQSRVERAAKETRWYVSEQGVRFLAASHHLHVLRFATAMVSPAITAAHEVRGGREASKALVPKGVKLHLQQIKHTKGVYHFLTLLHQQLRVAQGGMVWWVPAAYCERSFSLAGQVYHLRPDAECQFTLADGQQARMWLEWDTGTMQQTGLTHKLQAYARYARSREWAREQMLSLPMLLFVVPDKAQEDKVSRLFREECLHTGLRARITTKSRLDREGGPLAAIWRNPLLEEGEETHERSALLPSVVRLSG